VSFIFPEQSVVRALYTIKILTGTATNFVVRADEVLSIPHASMLVFAGVVDVYGEIIAFGDLVVR